MANNAAQRAEAPHPNNTGVPDNLKSGIESLSGFSMDDVRVHYNSSMPATVQALAYTQGTDIHVAPGQEKCLPHEAWHVAQQMAGRVSPTTNINGMPVNDNAGLEHEADVMGEKAVQMVGDKSPKNKQSYGSVVQCKNWPAYFETKNDEGCENSRYYVDEYSYVRIAPINANRLPTQEYHEEKRNFVYINNDLSMVPILHTHFNFRKWLNDKYVCDNPTPKSYNSESLDFNHHGFKTLLKLAGTEKNFEKIVSDFISHKPANGLVPYDWNDRSTHPSHPIAKVEPYKDPEESENLSLYRAKKDFALFFAKVHKDSFVAELEKYTEFLKNRLNGEKKEKIRLSIANLIEKITRRLKSDDPKKIMDEYFSLVWYKKIKEASQVALRTKFFNDQKKWCKKK